MKRIVTLLISFILLFSIVACNQQRQNCTVRFYNADSTLIQTYSVEQGSALTKFPSLPSTEKKGNTIFIFEKWVTSLTDKIEVDFSKINEDLEVYALCTKVKTFEVENAEMGYYALIENNEKQTTKIIRLPMLKGNVIEIKLGDLDITDYKQIGESIEISANAQKEILETKEYGDFNLVLKTEKDGESFLYEVKLSIVTKIIETKEDLEEVMSLATEKFEKTTVAGYTDVARSADGYFVLNDNIDFSDDYFGLTATGYEGVGFVGIFDGRGYTVRNISVKYESEGLFGRVGDEGIIRDVAFLDVKNTTNNGNASYVRRNIVCYVLSGTIENVYVEANRGRIFGVAPFSGAVGQYAEGGTIRNLVVNMTESSDKNYQDYIGTAIGAMMANATKTSPIEHIICISQHYDAIGVTPDYDYTQSVTGIEIYKTIAAIKGANNTYSSEIWDTEIWNIDGAIPVFKSSNLAY